MLQVKYTCLIHSVIFTSHSRILFSESLYWTSSKQKCPEEYISTINARIRPNMRTDWSKRFSFITWSLVTKLSNSYRNRRSYRVQSYLDARQSIGQVLQPHALWLNSFEFRLRNTLFLEPVVIPYSPVMGLQRYFFPEAPLTGLLGVSTDWTIGI